MFFFLGWCRIDKGEGVGNEQSGMERFMTVGLQLSQLLLGTRHAPEHVVDLFSLFYHLTKENVIQKKSLRKKRVGHPNGLFP